MFSSRSPVIFAAVLVVMAFAGCAAHRPAPVIDRGSAAKVPPATAAKPSPKAAATVPESRPETHTVRAGDTLFAIALDYGLEYRDIAAWNNIDNPSVIRVGQVLRLRPPGTTVSTPLRSPPSSVESRPLGTTAPASPDGVRTEPAGMRVPYSDQAFAKLSKTDAPSPPPKPEARPEPPRDAGEIEWSWPTTGKVIQAFNGTTAKGIAIAGKSGQPVLASAGGRVIYSGTGIRGLGRLLVIKHNETFFSVYGHNRDLLVKEGQTVSKGQRIAEMGDTDADQVKLHFEIRRFGQPVDPVRLLPDRAG